MFNASRYRAFNPLMSEQPTTATTGFNANIIAGSRPRLVVLLLAICYSIVAPARAPAAWDPVPTVDWSKLKPSDFRDDELDIPFFLEHFHELLNGIQETGPERGWIDIRVWRGESQQHSYNARVMESYLTVAWFYCTDRPWNIYRGNPAVRQRLEAMFEYWLTLQSKEGQFSEYGPGQYNLPATAFATKFMGQTLTLLKDGPPINADLLRRVTEADRKAIVVTLTDPDLYAHGKTYTNQFCNVFAGAPAYIALHPDPEITRLLNEVFPRAARVFQSPAGFFYERDGPDFGYTLHTTNSDMTMAYFYLKGTPLGELIEQQEAKWVDWLGYNLLREPDGSTFVINRCIETRQQHADWQRQESPMGQRVELARAFASTIEERTAQAKEARARLEKDWPNFPPLAGREFGPYSFAHRTHFNWFPTEAQRAAAIAMLPYLARHNFVHQRVDDRFPLVCTYVRRPTYYAAFNAGAHRMEQQRFGLGILWNPVVGTVLQSQTNNDFACWGTRIGDATAPVEAGDLTAEYRVGQQAIEPEPGHRDLQDGDVEIDYSLGDEGRKSIVCGRDGIEVIARHGGAMVEQLPLLTPQGKTIIEDGRVAIDFGGAIMVIEFDPAKIKAKLRPDPTTARRRAAVTIGAKQLAELELTAVDELRYRIGFNSSDGARSASPVAPAGDPYPPEVPGQ
jgi:hypothetical protein